MQHKLAKYRSWGGTGCASETLWFSYALTKGQLGIFSVPLSVVTSHHYLLITGSRGACAGPSRCDLVRPVKPALPPVSFVQQLVDVTSRQPLIFFCIYFVLLCLSQFADIQPPHSWSNRRAPPGGLCERCPLRAWLSKQKLFGFLLTQMELKVQNEPDLLPCHHWPFTQRRGGCSYGVCVSVSVSHNTYLVYKHRKKVLTDFWTSLVSTSSQHLQPPVDRVVMSVGAL